MFKKILIILILSLTFFVNTSFAVDEITVNTKEVQEIDSTKKILDSAQDVVQNAEKNIIAANKDITTAENGITDTEVIDKNIAESGKQKAEEKVVDQKTALFAAKEALTTAKSELTVAKEAIKVPEHNYNQALLGGTAEQQMNGADGLAKESQAKVNELKQKISTCEGVVVCESYKEELKQAKSELQTAQILYEDNKKAYVASDESKNDVTSAGFMIGVNDISPGMDVTAGDTVKQSVNNTLGTIIQNMMMLLGSLALLVMTIGAGFIILHHGQDELLSKGKAIFMSGVYALVVSLSSYYLIAIFRYILYTGNN